jgi:anti-sigma B factor antagonist
MTVLDFGIRSARLGTDSCVLAVDGELDAHAAPRLQRELSLALTHGMRSVVVDLSAVPFVDSTVLGVLVDGRRRLHERGGTLVLVTEDRRVLRILEVTGLDRAFTIERSLVEALSSLSGGRSPA